MPGISLSSRQCAAYLTLTFTQRCTRVARIAKGNIEKCVPRNSHTCWRCRAATRKKRFFEHLAFRVRLRRIRERTLARSISYIIRYDQSGRIIYFSNIRLMFCAVVVVALASKSLFNLSIILHYAVSWRYLHGVSYLAAFNV